MWFDPRAARDLLASQLPQLRSTGTARDLGTARLETLATPSAWVVQLAETAGEVRYEFGDFVEQLVQVRFAVVLGVRDLGDRTGERAGVDLLGLREPLHRTLCAWKPAEANHCCRFARGALVGGVGSDGTMFWQDEFTVTYDRRTAPEAP